LSSDTSQWCVARVLWELDMMDNNDTDLGPNNNVFDRKVGELIARLYWDTKCGRAAAEYNLKEAAMIEMIFGHVVGEMHDGDNFWDDLRWMLTERGRCTRRRVRAAVVILHFS
jgi:hypothetical protein